MLLRRFTAMAKGVADKAFQQAAKGKWVDPATVKNVEPKGTEAAKPSGKYAEAVVLNRKDTVGLAGIAVSPDGKFVARMIGSPFDLTFGIINTETSKTEKTWKLTTPVGRLAWSADGKSLAALIQGEATKEAKSRIVVWETATWEEKAAFEIEGFPGTFAASADCNFVATATSGGRDKDGAVKVWDVSKKKEIFSEKITTPTVKIAMSANGKTLTVSGTGPNKDQVAFVSLPGGKITGAIKCRPEHILSADGATVVEWFTDNTGVNINVWSTKAAAKGPRTIKVGKWVADQFVLLNKDQHLAVSGGLQQDEVRVFDLKTLKEVDSFKIGKPTGGLRSFVWMKATPDSALILTEGTDKTVRLWSTPFGPKPKDDAPMPKEKDK